MRRRYLIRLLSVLCVALTLCAIRESCRAEFVFFGPSPYLSVADSPFPISSNPSFNLEDFEDDPGCVPGPGSFCGGGKIDAPGVRVVYGSTGHGISVDADDGSIDGSGADGASATAIPVFFTPQTAFYAFQIEFDANELGFYPTAVGIALTDGAGYLSGLSVYDANGNVANLNTWDLNLNPATTDDDRFIGVTNPVGISGLMFGKTIFEAEPSNVPRLDHLQYGLWIPEPSGAVLVGSALGVISIFRVRRRLGQ